MYVLSGPVGGLGTLAMCFDPNGTTMEEAFAFPDDEDKIDSHEIPLMRLVGCELDYVSPMYFKTRDLDPPYFSTNGSACSASAGVISMQAIKILFRKEREKNPNAFPHLEDIPLITMPYARRIDLWDPSKCGIVNVMEY